jgi:cation:H+ antiporter
VFVAYYAAYVAYLILRAAQHDSLEVFGGVMLLFVVPLTVLTLLLVIVRERRRT